MNFKNYYFGISFIIGLISILPFESKINAQLDDFAQNTSFDDSINLNNLKITNQEAWQISQQEHHHHNSETNHPQEIKEEGEHSFLDDSAQNTSFDDSINLNNLKITNQEAWQISQQEHHHHNSENNHQQETEEEWEHSVHGEEIFWLILVDQLEYRVNNNSNTFNWDAKGWVGGDYQRLWLKTEGDVDLESGHGEAEIQVLYGKLIAPFWDLQVGVRYDQLYGDDTRGRGFAVIGIEGVAPYFFHIDTALFVSHQGDISLRFKTEYELLLSQKLILQPSLETNIAIQQVEDFGIGSGFNDLELGLRLRYEITRNFAPYIGINWTRLLGDTADFAREEGESVDEVSGVLGLRLLF